MFSRVLVECTINIYPLNVCSVRSHVVDGSNPSVQTAHLKCIITNTLSMDEIKMYRHWVLHYLVKNQWGAVYILWPPQTWDQIWFTSCNKRKITNLFWYLRFIHGDTWERLCPKHVRDPCKCKQMRESRLQHMSLMS